MLSRVFRQQTRRDPAAREVLSRLADAHCTFQTLTAGDHLPLDSQTNLDILWPSPDADPKSRNNTCLVLRLTCRGHSVLLPADIQTTAETALIAAAPSLKSEILIAPHHGSAEATTADFIDAVSPALILSSNAHHLTHKQLEFNNLATPRPLYRTDNRGAITVTIDQQGALSIKTFRR